jgi:hypothetical protein
MTAEPCQLHSSARIIHEPCGCPALGGDGDIECANCGEPFVPGPQATPESHGFCSAHCLHQSRGDRCPADCPFCDDNEVP